jgi:sulfur carrier protein ThiS adenylyltransferase
VGRSERRPKACGEAARAWAQAGEGRAATIDGRETTGAIGSEIALLLARSGVGRMILIDREKRRPANLSRHAAAGRYVGKHKADAMAATIRDTFSDVTIVTSNDLLWRPAQIGEIVRVSDLLVDATGNGAGSSLVSPQTRASGSQRS